MSELITTTEDIEAVIAEYRRLNLKLQQGTIPLPTTITLFFLNGGDGCFSVGFPPYWKSFDGKVLHGDVFERPPTRSPMFIRHFNRYEVYSPYNTCNS